MHGTGLLPICLVFVAATTSAATLTVTNSESIQAAVKLAQPGDTIKVMPGVYKESVYIDKDGIRLLGVAKGNQWPTLDGENTRNDGILVSGHNVTIERLYVRRYLGNGIMTQGANNFAVIYNRIDGPGFYGVFPQYGQNGLVAHNKVSGINGSAMYVGMSQNIDIVGNETADNHGFGIEVENSSHVLIERNYSHGNTIGIVLNLIPGLPIKKEEDIIVRDNFVIGNGATAEDKANDLTSAIDNGAGQPPEGSGLLINGADGSTIVGNWFERNPGAAIFVMDHNFGQMFPVPDPKVDPFPDDTQVLDNNFVDNGEHAFGRTLRVMDSLKLTRVPDLLVAGRGRRNCITDKESITSVGADHWTECKGDAAVNIPVTMRLEKPIPTSPLSLEQKGRLAYLAVCTGCHSFSARVTGPPMVAARTRFIGDPQKLADWIAHPTKVRPDYPAMPPQNYLPADVRLEVAKYVLGISEP